MGLGYPRLLVGGARAQGHLETDLLKFKVELLATGSWNLQDKTRRLHTGAPKGLPHSEKGQLLSEYDILLDYVDSRLSFQDFLITLTATSKRRPFPWIQGGCSGT